MESPQSDRVKDAIEEKRGKLVKKAEKLPDLLSILRGEEPKDRRLLEDVQVARLQEKAKESGKNSGLDTYIKALEKKSPEEIQAAIAHIPREMVPYFFELSKRSQVIGTAALLLYKRDAHDGSHTSNSEVFVGDWMSETIDRAAHLEHTINEGFARAVEHIPVENETTRKLIEAIRQEIILIITECLHIPIGIKLATLSGEFPEPWACMEGVIGVQIPKNEDRAASFKGAVESVMRLKPAYRTMYESFFKNLSGLELQKLMSGEGTVPVPILIGFLDVRDAFVYMQSFVDSVIQGFANDSQKVKKVSEEESILNLGSDARLHMKGESSAGGQARIRIEGQGEYQGFNIRLDRDEKRRSVGVDIARVEFEEAMVYATQTAKLLSSGKMTMKYDKILDERQCLKPSVHFPSIVRSDIGMHLGHKMGMIVALATREGSALALRDTDSYFSYHTRNFVGSSKVGLLFFSEFKAIIADIQKILTTARP